MAADMYTEIVGQSFSGRIGQAIKGVLIGGVLLLVGIVVLFWNEGRAVRTAKGLAEGEKIAVTVPTDAINPANDGKLVCFAAGATTDQKLSDPQFGIAPKDPVLKLQREVRMYQWKESEHTRTEREGGRKVTKKTYTYDKVWDGDVIDSSSFRHPEGHANPPMPFSGRTFIAAPIKAGAFQLTPQLINGIRNFEPLPVSQPPSSALDLERRDDAPPPASVTDLKVVDGCYYRGADPLSPQIGDVKISFSIARPGPVTVLARQDSGRLAPYATKTGTQIIRLRQGTYTAAEMFAMDRAENAMLTWLLRLGGLVAIFIALMLILFPLRAVADVIPILGDVVGLGALLASLVLSMALSLVVISLGWLLYRPLLGIVLLALAAAGVIAFRKMGKSRRARLPQLPPARLATAGAAIGGTPALPPLPPLPPSQNV